MALFLVWHDGESAIAEELAAPLDRFELRPGLTLVDSELGLSPLYHRIKSALPQGSALLVAPLATAPKFKRMAKGATGWSRALEAPGFARINNLD
ncbi:MAG TPA: hypothetical protein VF574_09270 [Allosphingosinicella sp.]|jgi:hypothetical protein